MVMNPPSGGPASGPTSVGMVSSAMAETSSLRGHSAPGRVAPPASSSPRPCLAGAKAPSPDEAIGGGAEDRPAHEDDDCRAKNAFGTEPVRIQPPSGMKIASATI